MFISHHHPKSPNLSSVREAIFGLEDGVVSTLGAVVGIAIGTQSQFIVILSGTVVIAVEALSMAAGSYLSSKSEREIAQRYLAEERWQIANEPEKEKQELIEFYTSRGFSKKEINILVARVTSNDELWLEEMAYHELKIFPTELENPSKNAWIMGASYIIGGIIPLSSFFLFPIHVAIWIAIGLSAVALFTLGAAVTKITYRNWIKSGLEMVVIAMSAAIVGFVIAQVVEALFPLVQ